ncbi:MAG: hypothetical protein OEY59_01355 [Deltaproteobacteria bacterium]|nr:hypothetical protein [Deltaproteobacteria bacterium]
MLDQLSIKKDSRNRQKAGELFAKGIDLIHSKLFARATIELQDAYDADPSSIAPKLDTAFNNYFSVSDYEASLAVGLVLIKAKNTDYELANKLGNCARHQRNFKQANNLYRHALKINQKYSVALWNLAASMSRVEKYDDQVQRALQKMLQIPSFILPDYYQDPEIIDKISDDISHANESSREDRINALVSRKNEKLKYGEDSEVENIVKLIIQEEKSSTAPTYKQVSNRLQEIVIENEKPFRDIEATILRKDNSGSNSVSQEDTGGDLDSFLLFQDSKNKYHGALYDVGLFSIVNNDWSKALEIFSKLKQENSQIEYIDMLIDLAKYSTGKEDEAIEDIKQLLGNDTSNRFLNVNIGLMYKKTGNRLLTYKYLVCGAALLERSDGFYRRSDMVRVADRHADEGRFKKALAIYKVVISETKETSYWMKTGEIYLLSERYPEATQIYKDILSFDPNFEPAKQGLHHIHDIYAKRADENYRDSKFKPAAVLYEKALLVLRSPETLKKIIAIYKVLNVKAKVEAFTKEFEDLQEQLRQEENEKTRQSHIQQALSYKKSKNYFLAIEFFEKAFRMKLDKDILMQLAAIYKGLKKNYELQDLMLRWNNMVEYEEKLKKFKKQEERSMSK